MFSSLLKVIRGIMKIRGTTDNTLIGNVGDRLKVDAAFSSGSGAAEDYYFELAKGNISGHGFIEKFGYCDPVDELGDDVWDLGGEYPFPTSATLVYLKSDKAGDAAAGIGARTVEIQGVDSSYATISETVTMNGITEVASTNSYLRIYRMKVITVGSLGYNEGKLVCRHSGLNQTIASIIKKLSQTFMAIYTIPLGKTGYIFNYTGSTIYNKSAKCTLMVREFGEAFQAKHRLNFSATQVPYKFQVPLKVEEKGDVKITAFSDSGSTGVSATFCIILVDN